MAKTTEKKTEITPDVIYPMDDRVTIRITPPTEADEEKGMFVSVNGYNAYIKYNEDVKVPSFVAKMLHDRQLAIKDMKKHIAKAQSKE